MTEPNGWLEIAPEEEKIAFRANPCDPRASMACQAKLHLAVFFDGMTLSIDEDSRPPSNIGRLYKAWPSAPLGNLLRRAVYVPGLGTDMTLSHGALAAEQAATLGLDKGKDALRGPAIDTIRDDAVQRGRQVADDVWQGRGVGKSVKDAVSGAARELPGELKDAFGKVIENPVKHGVKVVKDAAWDAARAGAEHFDVIRDSEWLSKALNVGVQPRITQAMKEFKKAVADAEPLTLTEIQVSVFGCDWGGGLARAFLNELCSACKEGDARSASLEWQLSSMRNVPLRLMFVGLFDSCGYREGSFIGYAASLVPLVGLKNEIADQMELPAAVEHAVHFVAGHEHLNRVHTLGGAALLPLDTSPLAGEVRQERIFPGTSRDVSGAYFPQQQGRENAIGLVCLQEMWRIARLRGVPFDGVSATKSKAGRFGEDFDIESTRATRQHLSLYVRALQRLTGEVMNVAFASRAIRMMGGQRDFAEALFVHRMVHVAWLSSLLRLPDGSVPQPVADCRQQGGVDMTRLILKSERPGREILLTGKRINPLTDYERACLAVYLQPPLRLGPVIETVFSTYVHMPVDIPEQPNAFLHQPNVPRLLRERCIDDGEDMRRPNWIQRIKNFAANHFGFDVAAPAAGSATAPGSSAVQPQPAQAP